MQDFSPIPFAAKTADLADSNGQPQVKVDLEIDAASVRFKAINDRHECKLHVTIFYIDSHRRILGSDWRIIEGMLSNKTYDHIMKTGIPFSITIPPKAGRLMLKIVVLDEQTGVLGSRLVKLR